MLPRTIQLLMLQLVLLAFARFSAQLPAGSVASFNYADNIQTVPTVLFGNAFALASFPYLSEAFAKAKIEDFSYYLLRSTKAALYLLIPSAVGLYLFRVQIVRLILGSGHFGWEQTITTAMTLGMFAIGLVALGLIPLYLRAFFALHDTKTPMIMTIPVTILSIGLGWFLAFSTNLGVAGLALAASLASICQLVALYLLLRRKIKLRITRELAISALTYLLLAAIMAMAIQITKYFVGSTADLRYGVNILYQTTAGIGVGVLVYLGLSYILRLPELEFLWKRKNLFTKN
jgi:putative peptidoglycan lipid II flippase